MSGYPCKFFVSLQDYAGRATIAMMEERGRAAFRFLLGPVLRRLAILGLAAGVLLGSCCPEREKPKTQDFPLFKGAFWVYEGKAKWTRRGTGEVVETAVTWKMEVTQMIERQHVQAAVLKGHPLDLAWYEEGKARGDYLVVRVGPGKYYLLDGEEMRKALDALRRGGDLLAGIVREWEFFLDLPLSNGKLFGETEQMTRTDRSYCWFVDGVEDTDLKDVAGVPTGVRFKQYRLLYQSRPAHEVVHFVPGVGITRFEYVHHGTVSETDVRLVEYHKGAE
jgi:hypothetical protein